MVKILVLSILLLAHPVHVSFLSIDYTPENRSLNLFLKIYYDDFLIDVGVRQSDKSVLDSLKSLPFMRDLITRYTNEKIRINVNNKIIPANLREFNLTDNELRMNLSSEVAREISTVTVQNHIMTDLYSDQANMVIVKINDFEEGVKLTSEKTEQIFKISKTN